MSELLVLFGKFMHIYFWVYLVVFVLVVIYKLQIKEEPPKRVGGPDFTAVVGLTLWFMSWQY